MADSYCNINYICLQAVIKICKHCLPLMRRISQIVLNAVKLMMVVFIFWDHDKLKTKPCKKVNDHKKVS